jgi:lipopolysaccharide heptosyltransferase II
VKDPARILVFGYRHLGDSLFLTPMLRALKRRFPAAEIVVTAHGAGAAVLEHNPHVARIERLAGRGLRAKLALLPALRRERFDAAIVAQHTLPNAVLARAAGCPVRVGLGSRGCRAFLTHPVGEPELWHEAHRYLALAAELGAEDDGGGLDYHPTTEDREAATEVLARLGLVGRRSAVDTARPPLVALFPGSSPQWSFKRWPADRFARLGDELVRRHGTQLVVVGGADDRTAMAEVSAGIGARHAVADGPGSLGRFAAVLAECDVLVTNDSGPMHLATAVGTRVVDLAGPSDPRRTGPYGPGHVVVQKVPPGVPKEWAAAPDPALPMKLISVDEVLAAVAGVLAAA